MSHEDFVEVVECHGGRFEAKPGPETQFVVVGQRDLPLKPTGAIIPALRRALASSVRVMTEDDFLAALGLDHPGNHQLHSISSITESLGVPRERIAAWVKAGLIKPAYTEHGVWFFDFRQVSVAKMICDMVKSGVTVSQLRKSLERLARWLPEAQQSLENLTLVQDDGRLLVRLADGDIAAMDGQLQFDFTEQPDPLPIMRIAPGPRDAGEWFEQGLKQEKEGFLQEAERSYRQALQLGGPDTRVCCCLANVLRAIGQREVAVERYRQRIEIDPQFIEAWNNLGVLLSELERYEEACDAFRKVLAIDADHARARYNLADALDDMGRSKEAADHWRAYLRYDASSQWASHAKSRLRKA